MIDFQGKVVLITGGGAGIGRDAAEAFGKLGASVAVLEKDPALADDVRASLDALGIAALVVEGDATLQADVDALAHAIEDRFGKLDVLVNNVGHSVYGFVSFETYTDEQIDTIYNTNFRHILIVTRAMIPLIRKAGPGSSIISLSSVEGFRGMPKMALYGAFKSAITGFTKSLALELAPEGIRVNLIAPETSLTKQVQLEHLVHETQRHNIPHWIPLGRFGAPSDSTGCILFLASPLAAWVTGTSIHVDGGAYAAGGWYQDEDANWTNMPVIKGQSYAPDEFPR